MPNENASSFLEQISALHFVWAGLVVVTVGLLVLIRTRWGQSQPLRKCAFISMLVHLLMGIYATTVPIVDGSASRQPHQRVHISRIEPDVDTDANAVEADDALKPWERFPSTELPTEVEPLERPTPTQPMDLVREPTQTVESAATRPTLPAPTLPEPNITAEPQVAPAENAQPQPVANAATGPESPAATAANSDTQLPDIVPLEQKAPRDPLSTQRNVPDTAAVGPSLEPPLPEQLAPELPTVEGPERAAISVGSAEPQPSNPAPATAKPELDGPGRRAAAMASSTGQTVGTEQLLAPPRAAKDKLPSIYQWRASPQRQQLVDQLGGNNQTEAAVKSALAWLASVQSADGHWDASQHGAGQEQQVFKRDRDGAGYDADTGITSLALLAFLGAGHTHQQGSYQETVRRGVAYLLSVQSSDGNLAGPAKIYSFMYCHGMSTFALSECYAMTHDPALERPVRKAAMYILRGQHRDGGWRYRPGDRGDTSVFGWQLMALKSAELAGITLPEESRRRMKKFVTTVSGGQHGGLASYRQGEAFTRPMTAEALASRIFLGMRHDDPAGREAAEYLMGELPGTARENLYYWYYGTISLYHWGGPHWERWNDALTATLVREQRSKGPLTGSWDPAGVWSGHGGRVYSTALSALCLEVYYRFLPLYAEARHSAKQPAAVRPRRNATGRD